MDKSLLQKAAELEAQAKALRRAEKQFWDDVEARAAEVREHLNVGHSISDGADIPLMRLAIEEYGIMEEELYEFITSDAVKTYYPKWREKHQTQSDN